MVRQTVESRMEGKIRCDACPVMCYIAEGRAGACDRYANEGGDLVRLDPFTVLQAVKAEDGAVVPFLDGDAGEWDGDILRSERPFITAIGAGTTYPDYKPAPFIVARGRYGDGGDGRHLLLLRGQGEDRHRPLSGAGGRAGAGGG